MKYKDFLLSLTNCPFCNLSEEQIILENKTAQLLFANFPYTRFHLLVIPKRHSENILQIKENELRDLNSLINLGFQILDKIGYENYSLLLRNGDHSGKSVDHLHYHLLPQIELHYTTQKIADNREKISKANLQVLRNKIHPLLKLKKNDN